VAPAQWSLPGAVAGTPEEVPTMSNTTDHGSAPWHETISAYRARGGRPADHPAVEELTQVAGRRRWVAHQAELVLARGRLERVEGSTTDRRVESIDRWTVELLVKPALADWFLDGLPEEVVEHEEAVTLDAWDRLRRPWAVEVVIARTPYQCAISGRTDGPVALKLTSRVDDLGQSLLLHPAVVMAACKRGMDLVDGGLDLIERTGPEET
jgi:hypothetical protein